MEKTSIFILSYQPIVMDALLGIFNACDQFVVIGSTGSSDEAEELVARSKPDICLLDCGLPDRGLTTMQKMLRAAPLTKVVIFTGIESPEHAVRSLDAGAAGYISSACTKMNVLAAIEFVVQGQTVISPHIASKAISVMRMKVKERQIESERRLSHREKQIAKYLLQGWSNRAIAERIGLTEKTIKHYMSSLMQKFDAKNRLELAMALPRTGAAQTKPEQSWLQ